MVIIMVLVQKLKTCYNFTQNFKIEVKSMSQKLFKIQPYFRL